MTKNPGGTIPQAAQATAATVAQRTERTQDDRGRKVPLDHLPKNQGDASLAGRAMAHRRWGLCEDRTAATAKARATFQAKFLDQAGGDPVKAESLRKSFYAELALKSAQARRRNAASA
ncbi:hypothetical protein [Kribbella sp. DT2]|uniref:hypothetical protein n=1 Tax=Kribbella sp. DT2 TaxID=3393427 RepID=UPI003CE6E0D2